MIEDNFLPSPKDKDHILYLFQELNVKASGFRDIDDLIEATDNLPLNEQTEKLISELTEMDLYDALGTLSQLQVRKEINPQAYYEAKEMAERVAAGEKVSVEKTTSDDSAIRPLETISAAELEKEVIAELKFIVDGLLHEGLCIFSADPKMGKSLFAFDLCLSVAAGVQILGRDTNKSDTLYLALEDGNRRLQERMGKILTGKGIRAPPENCHLATAANPLDMGLLEQLEGALQKHPNIKLIVIDVFNRIRETRRPPGRLAYEVDSAELAKLKGFADKYNLCLMLIHHNRKARSADDPFQNILGSQGIFGAADEVLMFTKENRADVKTTLHVVSREMDDFSLILELDRESLFWKCAKDEEEINPIVETIKTLLDESPEQRWDGTSTQLLKAGERITGSPIASSAKSLSCELRELESPLLEHDRIHYSATSNGNAGKKHHFWKGSELVKFAKDDVADEDEGEEVIFD